MPVSYLQIEECLVCSVNTANMLLKPCGHMVACGTCSSLMRKCVKCRVPITEQTPIVIPQREKGMNYQFTQCSVLVFNTYVNQKLYCCGFGKVKSKVYNFTLTFDLVSFYTNSVNERQILLFILALQHRDRRINIRLTHLPCRS